MDAGATRRGASTSDGTRSEAARPTAPQGHSRTRAQAAASSLRRSQPLCVGIKLRDSPRLVLPSQHKSRYENASAIYRPSSAAKTRSGSR
jgi:hypothetical protein